MRSLRLLQADTPRNCHVRLGQNLSRKPPTDSTAHGSLPSRVTRKANCKRNLINHAKQITMEQSESDALLSNVFSAPQADVCRRRAFEGYRAVTRRRAWATRRQTNKGRAPRNLLRVWILSQTLKRSATIYR